MTDPLERLAQFSPEEVERLLAIATPEQRKKATEYIAFLSRPCLQLERQGAEVWVRHYFPNSFQREFTAYQHRFWQWGWSIEPDVYHEPRVQCDPRGSGKCLDAATEILCADGARRQIRDIDVGERILAFNRESGRVEVDFIRRKFHKGEQECLKIRTRSGKYVIATPEHKVLAFNGWKPASNLTLNDRIASPRRAYTDGTVERTDAEVRLLAYMIAEGATSSGNCNFTNADQVIVDDFYACAASMGMEARKRVRYRHDLQAGGRQWVREQGLDGKRSFEKRIPVWVFDLPVEQKWMFLAALIDTDGWVSAGCLGITLANEKLVEDIMYLFMQVGIKSVIRHRSHSARGAWELTVDQDTLSLCREQLPLRLKQDKLRELLKTRRYSLLDTYPSEIKYDFPDIAVWMRQWRVARIDNNYRITRDKVRRMVDAFPVPRWVWLEQADVFWDEIVSIEGCGVRDTYDVEVLRNHNLITNGLVTHNSTEAETWVVSLVARNRRKTIGYVSRDDKKAGQHFTSLKRKLESPLLLKDYPHLKPRVQKYKNTISSWSQERIITAAGHTIVPITLEGSNRGFKSEDDIRFDAFVIDDIDLLTDSPDVRMKLLELLKSEVLAAGTAMTVTGVFQNLIYRDSIVAMILDHRADILGDRYFDGPNRIMKWYDAEKRDLPNGAKKWFITAGEPFDPAIPTEYAQALLNQYGKETFDRESQQEVNKVAEDKDFREWDEVYHIITWSEFMAGFPSVAMQDANGCFIPSRWHVGRGYDAGTTREHPSAVSYVTRPDRTCPMDDCHFFIGEIVMPRFPYDVHLSSELVSPGRVAQAMKMFERDMRIRDSQIEQSCLSHEASAVMNTMIVDLPDELKTYFHKWKARKGSGVPQIQNLLEIDRTRQHPFRKHPVTSEPLMGRPRIYFVVADGQGELYCDESGKVRVVGATDSKGLARLRYEIPLYSHLNTGQKKIDDDQIDSFRGLMSTFGVTADQLTYTEQIMEKIPERHKDLLKKEGLQPEEELALVFAIEDAKARVVSRRQQFDPMDGQAVSW